MTDKKLADEEIIKALTELSRYTGFQKKYTQVLNATLDLINRQKAEADSEKAKIKICAEVIERQDAEIERLKNRISEQKAYTAELQNKIVKLKDYNENLLAANTGLSNEVLESKAKFDDFITNLLKKLVGEKE